MAEAIKDFFTATFSNPYIAGVIISMLPLIELRGGLPYIFFWLTSLGEEALPALMKSFVASFLGSSLICPLLLLFFNPLLRWLKSTKAFRRFGEWLERHFNKKAQKVISTEAEDDAQLQKKEETEEYAFEDKTAESEVKENGTTKPKVTKIKYFALFVFTAIPLPLTGVWSASAVAAILNLDFKKSLFFIILGNLVAALAISAICWIFDFAVFI